MAGAISLTAEVAANNIKILDTKTKGTWTRAMEVEDLSGRRMLARPTDT